MLPLDNMSAHTDGVTVEFLKQKQIKMIEDPPYSPDLAMCDFWLFFSLKNNLLGRRFQSEEEIVQTATDMTKLVVQTATDVTTLLVQTATDVTKLLVQTAAVVTKLLVQTATDMTKLLVQTAADLIRSCANRC
ncbi:histone-lysine N-methyltransferase SETMAR [Trichonephila clavipes]|uniref:Histone-lysine N-methyltransferase SETMAR n=1 Tax=Trichonephila clavipes TaxID=2585209 RepID=A0A8X7B9C1_TRICX|nr:histone-lysine N-methyltransferase SETMAR [Trichonephila clavipes]